MAATTLNPNGPIDLDAGFHQRPSEDACSQPDQRKPPVLFGNDKKIEDTRYLTPCYLDMPIEELRRRYWQDGVLWVKGLLDPVMINEFRAKYLSMVNEGTGMLKPGTDPVEGIFSGEDWRNYLLPGAVRVAAGLPDEGPFVENAIRSHHCQEYLDSRTKLGAGSSPLCAVPGGETTPVHYDQIFLRAGPPTSITAWVPIGDVEVEGGGLIYLDRAHEIGVNYEQDFSKRNADLSDEERISAFNRNMEKGGWLDKNASRFGEQWSRGWLVGEYEAGDVVFHTPYTIHAGAKTNLQADALEYQQTFVLSTSQSLTMSDGPSWLIRNMIQTLLGSQPEGNSC
uniref:Uncharacterized protein n=1 Tax=Bionectria ochroleuca TaxID=29856 RepID=A0A8H7N1U8_BIOOC